MIKHLRHGDILRIECAENSKLRLYNDWDVNYNTDIIIESGGVWDFKEYLPPPNLTALQKLIKKLFGV